MATTSVLVLRLSVHRTADYLLEILTVVVGLPLRVHNTAHNIRHYLYTKKDNDARMKFVRHIRSVL